MSMSILPFKVFTVTLRDKIIQWHGSFESVRLNDSDLFTNLFRIISNSFLDSFVYMVIFIRIFFSCTPQSEKQLTELIWTWLTQITDSGKLIQWTKRERSDSQSWQKWFSDSNTDSLTEKGANVLSWLTDSNIMNQSNSLTQIIFWMNHWMREKRISVMIEKFHWFAGWQGSKCWSETNN